MNLNCPFNKGNNMCFAVINSPNPCQPLCIFHKLLEVLSTMQSIDAKMATPDFSPIKKTVEDAASALTATITALPQPDLTPVIEAVKTPPDLSALVGLIKGIPKVDLTPLRQDLRDRDQDITKLKKAVSILASEIGEIKELVKQAPANPQSSLKAQVEALTKVVTELKEKVPTTLI